MSNTVFKTLTIVSLVVALVSLIYPVFIKKQVAYIDTAKLLDGYHGMKSARKAYEEKAASWQSNIDTLQAEVTRSIMDYEKESAGMTAKEKELSKELIRTKQKQFQDYQRAIQQQAQQEDAAMTQQVLDKVNGFLRDYGERKGYQIIFGTSQGNIVYADDALDITEEVLTELNGGQQ